MTTTFEPLSWVPDPLADLDGGRTDPPRVVWSAPPLRRSTPGPRPLPPANEYVTARNVERHLGAVASELAELRVRLQVLGGAADEAEGRLDDEGARADVAFMLATGFLRFLADLRAEADEAAIAIVEAARVEARLIHRQADPRAAVFAARLEQWHRLVTDDPVEEPPPVLSWRPVGGAGTVPEVSVVDTPEVPLVEASVLELSMLEAPMTATAAEDETTAGDPDFWAAIDEADTRRRVRRMLGRTGLLRVGAGACVGLALLFQLT
jgi:hypothetical protein